MGKNWFLLIVFLGVSSAVLAQLRIKHTVAKGDTVYNIAKRYGTTTAAIFKLNPEAITGIKLNAILLVPSNKPKPISNTDSSKTGAGARKNEVEGVLAKLGDQNPQQEKPKFKIHKVRRKESLYAISKKYKVSVDDIKRYNKKLYSSKIRKGDKVKIPIYTNKYMQSTSNNASSRLSRTTTHMVRAQETLFGIARRHGITVAELQKLNPGLGATLSIGQRLTVPTAVLVAYTEEKDPRFELHEVQPKETVYSLLKTLKISRDSLDTLNPYLKVDGLKAGMILRVPRTGLLTTSAIDFSGGSAINLEHRLSNFKPKKIALMLPFNLSRLRLDSIPALEKQMKKDRVLRISLDFYAGVLMAIDKAKEKGLGVTLDVYDTANSKRKILSAIAKYNFDELDAVIGPLYQANIEIVAKELKKYETPVFSPISNKESELYNNFFQTMPSKGLLQDKLIEFVQRDTLPKNIIIIADAKHATVREKLKSKFPEAKVVTPQKENFIYEDDIMEVLDENLRNWVFIESSDIPLISNVTPYLNARVASHQITLFTTDKNDAYDNEAIQNAHLSKLQFHYPSIDKENEEASKHTFSKQFKSKYGMFPNRYAIRGYDIAYDVLMRLGSADDVYHSVTFEGTTEYVENKFNYAKKALGGYYNKAVYLVKYDRNLKLSVVE